MNDFPNMFTVFFITLGPVKTIPTFFGLTYQTTPKFRKHVALKAAIIATLTCLFIALVGLNTINRWNVSSEALQLTGGILLFINALKIITSEKPPLVGNKPTADTPLEAATALAIFPLTSPIIITPYGVVAILFYMFIAQGSLFIQAKIIFLILLMMLLNYLGMTFSDIIMKFVPIPVFKIIGWIFAIMQAALAIQIIIIALKSLGIIPTRLS